MVVFKCGGVLVNRQHVVTAGHCIKNKNIEDLTVTLGEYNIAESYDAQERYPSETYKVAAMVVHPGFKFSPAADRSDSREARFTSSCLIFPFYRRFDVAVLQLSSPVSYMSHIAPICLPQVGRDPEVASLRSHPTLLEIRLCRMFATKHTVFSAGYSGLRRGLGRHHPR